MRALVHLEPRALIDIAARADLDDEDRRHLLRSSPAWLFEDLLSVWPPNRSLVTGTAVRDDALPYFVVYCGRHGWDGDAVELARQLAWRDIDGTVARWRRDLDRELPTAVRTALVHAAFAEREPRPKLSSMAELERRRAIEEMRDVHEQRCAIAWRLIEHEHDLWSTLVTGDDGVSVSPLLLDRADEMSDDVLGACVPAVLSASMAGTSFYCGIRLSVAADHARRWPRLRQLAARELADLVRDVVADGWTPEGEFGRPDAEGIAGLAELSDDRELLTRAASALGTTRSPARGHPPERDEERLTAVLALIRNPVVVESDLVQVVPTLDEAAVRTVMAQSAGPLHSACATRLAEERAAAEAAQPRLIPVPDDETLALCADPEAELRGHLRYLKAAAAQRDPTVDGLLASRFTTPTILLALPARAVLDKQTSVTALVADMIAEACADHDARWNRLVELAASTPRRSTTFQAWLEDLTRNDR